MPAHAFKPFRFGVQASTAASRSEWVAFARRVESLGYRTLTMPDHFTDQLAPVPALMAVADATAELRVGALVWDNDYKHPVVLAKELATIDLLSDGRLEVGIGAGWMINDYEQAGLPYDPPGVRIDRFVEGLHIIKGLFRGEPLHHQGSHYKINGLVGRPLPVQKPSPPILIGGGGKRVLGIAAREADIVGVNGTLTAGRVAPEAIASMRAEAVDEKVAWVRAAQGERDVELNVRAFFVSVTNERSATAEGIAALLGFEADEVLASPFALVGTPAQIVDDLLARRERWGFSYIIVGADEVDAFAPVVAELNGR
ncbi:MAG TPA: TIGR03621 family F420-dependent LLM class oxidoreductase [Acidimicrobiales bacterium]